MAFQNITTMTKIQPTLMKDTSLIGICLKQIFKMLSFWPLQLVTVAEVQRKHLLNQTILKPSLQSSFYCISLKVACWQGERVRPHMWAVWASASRRKARPKPLSQPLSASQHHSQTTRDYPLPQNHIIFIVFSFGLRFILCCFV